MSTAALLSPARDGLDGLPVGVLLCDGRGSIHPVTADAHRLLGGDPAAVPLTDDLGAPVPGLAALALEVLRTDTAATVAVIAGGRRLWLELYPTGAQVLAMVRPVQADALRDKGLLDPATGLPNRVLLFDRLGQSLRRAAARGTKTTFVLAQLGRPGEHALRDTAGRLASGLCPDHTVARYGANTLAVVVDHVAGTGEPITRRVVSLSRHPVRTGWATSDGTHSVHEVVAEAAEEL